ncbi:MAG: hypothetical protein IPK18_10870 [Sphingobacteriales bacterium]|nr:MAG: hypothetical protein IPK18_10870 [Sphingobacteriales bacterium]
MKYFYLFLSFFIFFFAKAQDSEVDAQKSKKFDKAKRSWAVGGKLRSDGFGFNFDYTHGKRIRASMLYQLEFGYYAHLSQVKQQSPYNNEDAQFKRFVYGKQNNLFAAHFNVGQKILLAERAKKNGVRIYAHYAVGFSLAMLKPYMLKVVDTLSLEEVGHGEYTFSNIIDVAYENGKNEAYFTNYLPFSGGYLQPIVGGSGFGKGWNLKFQPGIHLKTGFSFDWSKDEGVVKGLDLGFACDIYFKQTQVMLVNNKKIYPSVYVGFQIGKRK